MERRILLSLGLLLCQLALAAAKPPLKLTVSSLHFTAPAGWENVAVSSPMRKATWRTGPDPDAAEVAFFTFGKDQGGSVSENIQRWLGQFSESAEKGQSATIVTGGKTVTFVRSEGVFASGMPGAPSTPLPDYALRGAIIEIPEGLVFVKMTGPKRSVESAENAFTETVTKAAEIP